MPEPPSDNDTVPHPRNVKMTPNHPPTDTMLTDLEKTPSATITKISAKTCPVSVRVLRSGK
ncbi:ATP-dependent DNA helicase DinG [Neisseria gonorrhoeae]|uniref:ATP-dependent DNA helicase DinG n=1 Tax=Neisseria gonorrhoeae TaxID=485 RepID=A0A379B143_NEIGO|nr:ATP-dependent DNA helicase DinG [Neisseria gonorrhoeae]